MQRFWKFGRENHLNSCVSYEIYLKTRKLKCAILSEDRLLCARHIPCLLTQPSFVSDYLFISTRRARWSQQRMIPDHKGNQVREPHKAAATRHQHPPRWGETWKCNLEGDVRRTASNRRSQLFSDCMLDEPHIRRVIDYIIYFYAGMNVHARISWSTEKVSRKEGNNVASNPTIVWYDIYTALLSCKDI